MCNKIFALYLCNHKYYQNTFYCPESSDLPESHSRFDLQRTATGQISGVPRLEPQNSCKKIRKLVRPAYGQCKVCSTGGSGSASENSSRPSSPVPPSSSSGSTMGTVRSSSSVSVAETAPSSLTMGSVASDGANFKGTTTTVCAASETQS